MSMGLKIKKVFKGGIIAVIGYILSPLSWWNDLIVNIPISWFFASLLSKINRSFFNPAFILVYWLTNIVGLLMVHLGLIKMMGYEGKNRKKLIFRDILFSVAYTILIIILIKLEIIKPLGI